MFVLYVFRSLTFNKISNYENYEYVRKTQNMTGRIETIENAKKYEW